jgi:hypothetical protein
MYICEHCTEDASRLADQDASGRSQDPLSVVADDPVTTCSFCGKHRPEVDRLIAGPGVLICTDCLAICREIQEEDSTDFALERA